MNTTTNVPADQSAGETEAAANPGDSGNGHGGAVIYTKETDNLELEALRRFHFAGTHQDQPSVERLVPHLLGPYRDTDTVRTAYPLVISGGDSEAEPIECRPLHEQIDSWLAALAPDLGDAQILRDNVARLERCVRDKLAALPGPAPAAALLAEAGAEVRDELALPGEADTTLASQLQALVEQVAQDAQLLGFDEHAAVHLLHLCGVAAFRRRRASFAQQVHQLAEQLEDRLKLERSKTSASRKPETLRRSLGGGSSAPDPSALAAVLGRHRGSQQSPSERIDRIAATLDALRYYSASAPTSSLILISSKATAQTLPTLPDTRVEIADIPCSHAVERYRAIAEELTPTLRAVRTARLELKDDYQPARHDAWLAELNWDSYTREELLLVPAVVALVHSAEFGGAQLDSLSQLLRCGLPVKAIVLTHPAGDPGGDEHTSHIGETARFELGYFAISHREALVHQTASARPEHALRGLQAGLASTRSAVHIVAHGTLLDASPPALGPWLHTAAAIESRAHPLFLYDPEKGASWAQRFDLTGNPEAEKQWPLADNEPNGSAVQLSAAERTFTFADFALLEPAYHSQFCRVPDGVPDDELIPLSDYLAADTGDKPPAIPYVVALDQGGDRVRLAVTRRLCFASRDRARYWRTLQELAGLNNDHIRHAVTEALAQAHAESSRELQEALAAHAAELEQARREEAGLSMQRLTAALLQADFSAVAAAAVAAPSVTIAVPSQAASDDAAPATQAAEPEQAAEAAEADDDEALSFDEPWIDTALCTSCNDCLEINPLLFVYDGNKQARIGDATSGTFEDLVRGAEKCPARCIHPGKPKNADEPELEELVKRAEPFN